MGVSRLRPRIQTTGQSAVRRQLQRDPSPRPQEKERIQEPDEEDANAVALFSLVQGACPLGE